MDKQHTAVVPCLSYKHPRQTQFTWDYSWLLAYFTCGHAFESFRWDFISATLDSDIVIIVLTGGHALWKFYQHL